MECARSLNLFVLLTIYNIEEHGHEYYADAVHAAIIDGVKQEFSIL